MGRGGWVFRFLFGAVVVFGIIWLLFAGILANHVTTTTTTVTVPSTEILNNWKMIAREKQKHQAHQDMDFNYVSKRRVPNGPDPIHNRYIFLSYIFFSEDVNLETESS